MAKIGSRTEARPDWESGPSFRGSSKGVSGVAESVTMACDIRKDVPGDRGP